MDDDRWCASGDHCHAYDHLARHPAWVPPADPLCEPCITVAGHDVRALIWDYIDLEQLQIPSLSQALDPQRRGKAAPPMPLAGGPEALQAEMCYVATLWEHEVLYRDRLPERITTGRAGWVLDRAVGFLAPRLGRLARIPATTVFPRGRDDDPTDMCGWEAVHHLQALHRRARSLLGRTQRTTRLPGTCAGRPGKPCAGDLYRDEPRFDSDPCPVYCPVCGLTLTAGEYDQRVGLLLTIPPPKEPRGPLRQEADPR